MLLELRVNNLGIIEDIEWRLDTGLNIITGETGAGKSLVIDAVELLLTGTTSEDAIRHGSTEARIEGIFSISDDLRYAPLKSFLNSAGLAPDEDTLIVTCEVRRQKPGIVRINGHTVTKSLLRQVGRMLIDIHGQSDHLSLLDKKYHLDFLDAFAHTLDLRNQISAKVARLHDIESELNLLESRTQDFVRQKEFLAYQIDEIIKANLHPGEDEELEKEKRIMSFSEKLKENSLLVYQILCESDSSHLSSSVLTRLSEVLQALKKLVETDSSLQPLLDYVDKTVYGLEEVARDIRQYSDKLEFDPSRLEEIETRLDLIRNLKRKYGKTIDDILDYLESCRKELAGLELSSENRDLLIKEQDSLKNELGQMAFQLSQKRFQAAQLLVSGVKKELHDLEMSQMDFEISVTQTQDDKGLPLPDGRTCAFSSAGIDSVEFLASTNPGEPLKPLARIASTGEISRFTLALKSALSETDNTPVLIFDEVDIGVGGRSGDIIGKKLWNLARHHQVICVTHLPQIAAYADAHFCVRKQVSGDRAMSILDLLSGDSRLEEIALMLAGPGYSGTALDSARELVQKAMSWKSICPPEAN